jgi:hypothetical protein
VGIDSCVERAGRDVRTRVVTKPFFSVGETLNFCSIDWRITNDTKSKSELLENNLKDVYRGRRTWKILIIIIKQAKKAGRSTTTTKSIHTILLRNWFLVVFFFGKK